MDAAASQKDPTSDCIRCGDSELVRAGNSYWTCHACAPPPPPKPKTSKKTLKKGEGQADLDDYF